MTTYYCCWPRWCEFRLQEDVHRLKALSLVDRGEFVPVSNLDQIEVHRVAVFSGSFHDGVIYFRIQRYCRDDTEAQRRHKCRSPEAVIPARVSVLGNGIKDFTYEVGLTVKYSKWIRNFETYNPMELGFGNTEVENYVRNCPRIDLFLPEDPVACLDWERFGPGHIFRRTHSAIAALRWGAQSLPANCETSVLLCSATPSPGFLDEMKGWYGSLLQDEPLDQCLAHLGREYERGEVSLVAHNGTQRGLDLLGEMDMRRRRMQQFDTDLAMLAGGITRGYEPAFQFDGPIDYPRYLSTSPLESNSQPPHQAAAAPLTELLRMESQSPISENEVKERVQELITEDQERYPAAWFYHVDAIIAFYFWRAH